MQSEMTRPIVGIENRTAQEVFDIMCDRFKIALSAAEPWPFEHQNYNCPCIHPSQCDESCVKKPAPSVAVKTPCEVASQHIPEARVSLLSKAIRQGLNDYGWKNFGTLPEVLMGYIIQAEKAEADAHQRHPRDCGHDGGDLSEHRDNIGSSYTRSALSTQVQDVAVAEIVSAHGDPEAFGERELVALVDIQKFPYRTKLYAAAPAKQEG